MDTSLVSLPAQNSTLSHYTIIVSYYTKELFQLVNFVVLCGPLSFFGIGANILNMAVFIKQGFKDSMNISLLGLAMSDLACMITVLWISIGFNPAVAQSSPPFDTTDLMYLTGGWPHECFNRATSFITAFITLERCLCITTPLKVKTIITPRRTKIIITGIFVLMLAIFSPTYFVNSMQWKFNPARNKTIFSIHYAENRLIVETISFLIHSVLMSGICLMTVIICTIVLVVKLNEKARWRQSVTSGTESTHYTTSTKEKRVVKMITTISVLFIACFLPPTMIFFMMAYEPNFSLNGRYHNMFMVAWSSAFVLETINSSLNIFIYFNMSSKFKASLMEIMFKRERESISTLREDI